MQYETICGEHLKLAHKVSFYQGTESERINTIVDSLYTLQNILTDTIMTSSLSYRAQKKISTRRRVIRAVNTLSSRKRSTH